MVRAWGHEETKKIYLEEWLPLTPENRIPRTKKEFAQIHGISQRVITLWDKNRQRAIDEYNSEEWLKTRTSEMNEALIAACIKGSPQALKLFFQLRGMLVEKSEVNAKVEITASDYARLHNQNREYLRKQDYLGDAGMGQVQPESLLLPEKVRED